LISCPDPKKGSVCKVAHCAPKSGTCSIVDAKDGTQCSDGDACTADDACKKGACEGGLFACSCGKTADCEALEDGDLCNGTLYCDKASKKCLVNPKTVISCPSAANSACAKSTCNIKTGTCALTPVKNGSQCEDGDKCTAGDLCLQGKCKPGDTNTCPCASDADCASKDDGDKCNGTFFCNKQSKACEFNPASYKVCPSVDDTSCKQNACIPNTGKCEMHAAAWVEKLCDVPNQNGAKTCRRVKRDTISKGTVPCDDGDKCTAGDECLGTACKSGTVICFCATDADCAVKDDGDKCNGVCFCDKSGSEPKCVYNKASVVTCAAHQDTACLKNTCIKHKGDCVLTPVAQGKACDDGNKCTLASTCNKGACGGGKKSVCDDKNQCTIDSCDSAVGCVFKQRSCDDGNNCTVDACNKVDGKCLFDTKPRDSKTCTRDICSPKAGCKSTAVLGQRCSDGDGCSAGGTCSGSGCKLDANGLLHTKREKVPGLVSISSSSALPGGGLLQASRPLDTRPTPARQTCVSPSPPAPIRQPVGRVAAQARSTPRSPTTRSRSTLQRTFRRRNATSTVSPRDTSKSAIGPSPSSPVSATRRRGTAVGSRWAEPTDSRAVSAGTANSDGGYTLGGVGIDQKGQSRLWIVGTSTTGGMLWERFFETDLGAYQVQQLRVVPGDQLLIAGARIDSGKNKLWFSRRSRWGVELYEGAYTAPGLAAGVGHKPLVRWADGTLGLSGIVTEAGKSDAFLVRANAWGQGSCADAAVHPVQALPDGSPRIQARVHVRR